MSQSFLLSRAIKKNNTSNVKTRDEKNIPFITTSTWKRNLHGVNARRLAKCSMLMAVRKGSLQQR